MFCFVSHNTEVKKKNFFFELATTIGREPDFQNIYIFLDDKDDNQDKKILNELENIDDDLEKEGIVIVKMDDDKEAKEFGIDDLPALVYFENKLPAIYEGD